MADENSYHTVLVSRKPTDIEVLEGSYMYFKIAIKEQLSPMKFAIAYKEDEGKKGRKQDLHVYFSYTNKEPSAQDNNKVVSNVIFYFHDFISPKT